MFDALPRALRTRRTVGCVVGGACTTAAVAWLVTAATARLVGENLALRSWVSPGRSYPVDAPSAATMSGAIALIGGCLLCACVRPAKPRFLWRSAAGQGGASAIGLIALLAVPATTKATFVALGLASALIPALWMARLTRSRLAEYRQIPRRRA